MSKKIIFLCSSPRKHGNTNTLVKWAANAAELAGAQVEVVDVVGIKARSAGCCCCLGCQRSEKYQCVIEDGVTELLNKVLDYDTIVFATPVYFFGPNAQLKVVLDRMFSHIKMNADSGSFTLARPEVCYGLIATGGGEMDGGLSVTDRMFFTLSQFTGRPYKSLLMPFAPTDPQELAANGQMKEKAIHFGQALAGA